MSTLAATVLASPLSPTTMLDKFGTYALLGVCAVLFAETGLLVGFFLPGDTLLFSLGLLLATGGVMGHERTSSIAHVSLPMALVALPIAAIAGNVVGYWIGRTTGPHVFHRPKSRLFKPEYVTRAHEFFEKYGRGTVIVARFVPIVRTVATVLAGVSAMRFSVYFLFSVIGAILWADGVTLLGYWLGHIKFVQDTIAPKIDLIIVAVVVLSILPTLVHLWRSRPDKSAGAA